MPLPISDVFADLPDPRSEINRLHLLTDILTIALCGVISGADGWEDIAAYGRSKKDFFQRFLSLPNGIPSHDTFYRVFTRLDPTAFAERVGRWMAAACEAAGLIPIAVDGKSARRAKAAARCDGSSGTTGTCSMKTMTKGMSWSVRVRDLLGQGVGNADHPGQAGMTLIGHPLTRVPARRRPSAIWACKRALLLNSPQELSA